MSKHDPALIKQRSLTPEGELPEGLASYGHPVPAFRKHTALQHYRDMDPNVSTEEATAAIDALAQFIERDEPYAMEQYWNKVMRLDLTGYYRLLACLMTGAPRAA